MSFSQNIVDGFIVESRPNPVQGKALPIPVNGLTIGSRPNPVQGKALPIPVNGIVNNAFAIVMTNNVNAIAYDNLGRQVEIKPEVLDPNVPKSLIRLT